MHKKYYMFNYTYCDEGRYVRICPSRLFILSEGFETLLDYFFFFIILTIFQPDNIMLGPFQVISSLNGRK